MTAAVRADPVVPPGSRTTDHVVLVDGWGRPTATAPKAAVHDARTPLHLAFSCHITRADGSVLLTQRAADKVTWPGWWTNGCCGHPQLGETYRDAATRRVGEELGLHVTALGVALADFAYRSEMADGTVEHELCPVLVAVVDDGEPDPDPAEVAAHRWTDWSEVVRRAGDGDDALSPWCVEQVHQLAAAGLGPATWPEVAARRSPLLDRPLRIDAGPDPAGAAPVDHGAAPVTPAATAEVADEALALVRGPVADTLDRFLEAKAGELVAVDAALAAMVEEVRGLVAAGGKRLRPAFTYWGFRAAGGREVDEVFGPAAAMELLHTFALIHDDVMDRSATRRGRPSAFAGLAARHRAAGAVGDSDWFGLSAAVLVGDLAFVWADELLELGAFPAEARARARQVFASLRSEVIAGQYLDLTLAATPTAAEEQARRVALLKSARYTVTRPLLLGAALAGPGDAELERALVAYGDAVGLAFQMRDDVLGVFGDPATTGKSRLDDLREGKRTVLVLRALRLADPAGRALLARGLGDPALDEADAGRCRDVIASSGALASVEALVADRHQAAIGALDALDRLPPDVGRALGQLAASAIVRHR